MRTFRWISELKLTDSPWASVAVGAGDGHAVAVRIVAVAIQAHLEWGETVRAGDAADHRVALGRVRVANLAADWAHGPYGDPGWCIFIDHRIRAAAVQIEMVGGQRCDK